MIPQNEIILRLVLASIIGGLIGLEREVKSRPAGLRTHILVTVGSTLVMLVSIDAFKSGDPARLAAQVVSGIGFLGAGTILREGSDIRGLTTAACIWISGCIGLGIGIGYYLGSLVTAGIVLFSLLSLGFLEKRIEFAKTEVLRLVCKERTGLIGDIGTLLGKYNVSIENINILDGNMSSADEIIIEISVKIPGDERISCIYGELCHVEGVKSVSLKGKMKREFKDIKIDM